MVYGLSLRVWTPRWYLFYSLLFLCSVLSYSRIFWRGGVVEKSAHHQEDKEPTQASKLAPTARPVGRDVSLSDAIYYAATWEWDCEWPKKEHAEREIEVGDKVNKVLPEFIQKASDGELPIWGKPVNSPTPPVHKKIEPSFWGKNEIYIETTYKVETDKIKMYGSTFGGDKYKNLMTNKEKVIELWPHKPPNIKHDFTFIQLRELAKSSGWDFTEDHIKSQLSNFLYAIRQSGHDGGLKIYGRVKKHKLDELTRDEVLKEIPKEHWEEYEIDRHSLIKATGNITIVTYIIKTGEKGYADLHFNELLCKEWLKTKAESFKSRE